MRIRILWLNVRGGRVPGFLDWFREQADTYDIICLQEVTNSSEEGLLETEGWQSSVPYPARLALLNELETLAEDFERVFPRQYNSFPLGQALFVRKKLTDDAVYKQCFIYGQLLGKINTEVHQNGTWSGVPCPSALVTYNVLLSGGRSLTVANLHGLWSRRGKVDMKERDEQSQNILNRLQHTQDICARRRGVLPELVCGGDFNYHDDMRALHILEQSELFGGSAHQVNLNRAYGITDTRTKYYPPDKTTRQADYVLIQPTPSMYVESYTVDKDAPSDHAALRLELSF